MHSLTPEYLDRLVFHEGQLRAIRAIGDAKGRQALWYQQAPEILKSLRDEAVIQSSESSNRLEGVTVAPARLKPLILDRQDPRTRSEQEVAGYRDALALIHESGANMGLTGNVLLQLHQTLFRYMPNPGGHWKNAPNDIIEKHPDNTVRIRFKPTPPHLVEPQIAGMCENFRIAEQAGREPLVLVPLAILDFLCIHPFLDGNGRVARLMTLMLLYRFDYQVGRYVSLERVIEQSKKTYYETLEASSKGWHEGQHDVMPWLNYFWGVMKRAYDEFRERMDRVQPTGRGSKTEQIRFIVLRQTQPFSLTEIQEECTGVSREMVRHVLRLMREEGLVETQGRGRSATWRLLKPAETEKA
jgi:Fic family protein